MVLGAVARHDGLMTQILDLQEIPRDGVVVGVDGSDGSDGAVDWAADAAARQHRTLVIVHTAAPLVPWTANGYAAATLYTSEPRDAVLAAGKGITGAAQDRALARHPGLEIVRIHDIMDPRLGLPVAARHAHVLVVGSRGRGPLKSMLLGSVSVAVSRDAGCPVVVVRPGDGMGTCVLALVDGSPSSVDVLEYAARHASEVGQPLRITHLLWTDFDIDRSLLDEGARLLSEVSAGLGEKFPDIDITLVVDNIVNPERLIDSTTDVALIVVGHHPANLLHRMLYQSLSTTVVERARVPVAVVPTAAG